jgi:hypothetical protein
MSARATNLLLLALVFAALLSGGGAFLAGAPSWRGVVLVHDLAGFCLLGAFVWKRRIIVRSLRRHGGAPAVVPGVVLLVLILVTLATGFGWSSTGLPSVRGYSALTIHAALGVLIAAPLAVHAGAHWPRLGLRPGRRTLLRLAALGAGGVVIWQGSEAAARVLGLGGAARRFTGSRPVPASEDFPATQWLFDNPAPLDRFRWRLRIGGHAHHAVELLWEELDGRAAPMRATIDCTGGWYADRLWQGVPLAELLARVEPREGARSVVVRSVTGYWRRFSLEHARRLWLATRVDGESLTHGHGAPARLVVPDGRGYDWVKWVTEIEVSAAPAWLRWPLPV